MTTSIDSTTREIAVQRLSSPILIGRDDELRVLRAAVQEPPAVVFIEGEAGIGKTRLVGALLGFPELENHTQLLGSCQALEDPFPLGPLIDALRKISPASLRGSLSPVCGVLGPLVPELARVLPPAPESLADTTAERHRVFRALREILTSLSPFVLVFEDLHWADSTTKEFLRFLTADCPPDSMVVATTRPDSRVGGLGNVLRLADRADPIGLHLVLTGLDTDRVGSLVSAIMEVESISDEFAARVFFQTGGVPFAIEEALRLLVDRGEIIRYEGSWLRVQLTEMVVPARVRDSILERAAHLTEDARAILEVAAVLTAPKDETLIARVASFDVERVTQALSEALRSGLLVETSDEAIDFRHALARQAVYEAIPGPRRRQLHHSAAQALEPGCTGRGLSELATHFRQAGKMDEWASYAEEAGNFSLSLFDIEGAGSHFQNALSVSTLDTRVRIRIALKLGSVARRCIDKARSIQLLADVLDHPEIADGDRTELELRRTQLLLAEEGEDPSHFRDLADLVPALMPRADLAASAMVWLANPWRMAGTIVEHSHWLNEVGPVLLQITDPVVRFNCSTDHISGLSSLGDPRGRELAKAFLKERLEPTHAEAMGSALRIRAANLAASHLHLGYYDDASAYLDVAVGVPDHGEDALNTAILAALELQIDWATGRWDGLRPGHPRYEAALEARQPGCVGRALIVALATMTSGNTDLATEMFAEVIQSARRSGAIPMLATAHAAMARIARARGDATSAIDHAVRGLQVIADKGIWVWTYGIAPIAIVTLIEYGMVDEARTAAEDMQAGLEGRDAPAALAALEFCRGIVAAEGSDLDTALPLLQRSERSWLQLPNPYEAALVREHHGRVLIAAGLPGAEDLWLSCLETFETLGAEWDEGRLRLTMRRAGIAVPHRWRGGRKGYGSDLSPREREAAALAAQGKTNRQIAAAMFVSLRTAEHHVAQSMRKLGVGNRRELAQHLRESINQ